MAMTHFGAPAEGDPNPEERMIQMMGPSIVDNAIRQAIQHCWMILPQEKRTAAGVSAEIRRIVERALRDLEEDSRSFGIAP